LKPFFFFFVIKKKKKKRKKFLLTLAPFFFKQKMVFLEKLAQNLKAIFFKKFCYWEKKNSINKKLKKFL